MPGPFCKLADPAAYRATWDLTQDAHFREVFLDFFRTQYPTLLKFAVQAAIARGADPSEAQARADHCQTEFFHRLDRYAADPARHGPTTILTIDHWRDGLLREHGFADPFIDLKSRENAAATKILPEVCRAIDALEEPAQVRAIIEGVFAGNIFDMGSDATARRFGERGPDFFATRAKIPPRPWLIDDFDALARRWLTRPYRKAVIFVDNAGSDYLLGILPLARWLARHGGRGGGPIPVVLAGNQLPTLNDMTAADMRAGWPVVLEAEPSLRDLPISIVSTGTSEPLIDLASVSDELNAAADDADLVILEGMGRGIESNLHARFTCDALNIAMLKFPAVAQWLGGQMYDVVCRFR